MWTFLAYGAVLGLSAGLSPGPLLALVVSQTLRHGTREGLRVAAAPLFTDVPIICLGLVLLTSLKEPDFVLGVLSFIGCVFVGYLGLTSFRQQPIELDLRQDTPRSYFKGMLTNALSPHPYLFWVSVGYSNDSQGKQSVAAICFGVYGLVLHMHRGVKNGSCSRSRAVTKILDRGKIPLVFKMPRDPTDRVLARSLL